MIDNTPSTYPTCKTFAVPPVLRIQRKTCVNVRETCLRTKEARQIILFRGDADVVRISYLDPIGYRAELDLYLESGLVCMEAGFTGKHTFDLVLLGRIYREAVEMAKMLRCSKGTSLERTLSSVGQQTPPYWV